MNKIQEFLASVKTGWQMFWAKVDQDLKTLWANDKYFLLAFGAVILTVKFREILISLLVGSSNKIFSKTQQQDQVLANQENSNSQKADALVQQALAEPSKETVVTDDWNKK